jgi:membrane-associated phospholipid phosphatase
MNKLKEKSGEPLLRFRLREVLIMTDVYTLVMLAIYTILAVYFWRDIPRSDNLILINTVLAVGIISVATISERYSGAGRLFRLVRRIYLIPVMFLIYSQSQYYIREINPHLYDKILIEWDKAIFGANPTEWLAQFSHPALTEYLQFTYLLFFILPIMHGVELHLRSRDDKFHEFTRQIMFAFYLSYLMYFIMPAIGPRFFLHDFSAINENLPGLWLTEYFRDFINLGGGIPLDSQNPVAAVNRDCMPSGHTMITLINIILAFRYRSKLRWWFLVLGGSLIFSTVYLWYHYSVDIIAGVIFAMISLWVEPRIRMAFLKMGLKNA